MAEINWGDNFYFNVLTFEPQLSPVGAIALPTYGNYGGAFYTAGVLTTSGGPVIVNPDDPTTPVDALDLLFQAHDENGNDLALLEGILDIKPNQLDAEGQFYAGVAALAMIVEVLSDGVAVSPKALKHDAREAFHDLTSGLKHLPAQDVIELGGLLEANAPALPLLQTALTGLAEATSVHLPHHFELFA